MATKKVTKKKTAGSKVQKTKAKKELITDVAPEALVVEVEQPSSKSTGFLQKLKAWFNL